MGERELGAALFPQQHSGRESNFATPDFPTLQRELSIKGMTLLLLWQEYRESHPNDGYSYSHFCQRYKDWLGTQKRSMRQVHIVGEKCFVDYAGTTVPIVNENTAKHVSIYARGKRVACHARSQVRAGYSTLTEHMPSSHQFMAEWTVERFESWAGDIGDSTLQVTQISHKALMYSRWDIELFLNG